MSAHSIPGDLLKAMKQMTTLLSPLPLIHESGLPLALMSQDVEVLKKQSPGALESVEMSSMFDFVGFRTIFFEVFL